MNHAEASGAETARTSDAHHSRLALAHYADGPFWACLAIIACAYLALIGCMLISDLFYTTPGDLLDALKSEDIQYSIKLSLITVTISAILSVWTAVPIGYLMSRISFRGKNFIDAALDIPIVLPPLVIGLSLLILFQAAPLKWFQTHFFQVTYAVPSVVLAQYTVACAFAVRTMRNTFDSIHPRREQVALTLGCSRSQAFFKVVLPEARRGIFTAFTLAWARAMGEFGPILIFAGSTRQKTEVLPTTVFLELSIGDIEAALAVSLIMVFAAVLLLLAIRNYGVSQAQQNVI
ncbi:MAG: ABC transporter permease subunit [bacterium]|nr:ABC transporter permease subunit [bacterium]